MSPSGDPQRKNPMTPTRRPLRRSPDTASGKVMTKRVGAYDRTTLVLSYTASDALALRALAQSIVLKGNKKATLSLIARRALRLYRDALRSPEVFASETAELEQMVTTVPHPARKSPR